MLAPQIDRESPRSMLLWRQRIESGARPLCVSLWSGAGGLDLGLEQAGYDVAVAMDHDEWACQTHGHNSRSLVFCRDLSDPGQTKEALRELCLPPVALVAGGFPCQPYSRAGHSIIRHLIRNERREAVDERAFAWQSFIAAVEEIRPLQALAENVPDLARHNGGELLRDIVGSLEDLGYKVDVRILLARAFGVPQYRERLFIQAVRDDLVIAWPEGQPDPDATLRNAIRDLPVVQAGHSGDPIEYEPPVGTEAPAWARENMTGQAGQFLFDHICRDVREDDLIAFRGLAPGGTYLDVPPELRRYDDEAFTDKYKRLEWDAPSRTITAHIARDGYWYIHPEYHRTLSVREAARVQTFPDWFVFAGFPSNRFTQIGNAVPPLLGRAVGSAMRASLAGDASESTVPQASRLLEQTADRYWSRLCDWEVLVSEAIFKGRASDERLQSLLERLPDLDTATKLRAPYKNEHEKAAAGLARTIRKRFDGRIPDDAEALQAVPGFTQAVARLAIAQIYTKELPRTGSLLRVAERVSGVSRAGSLNGISHVILARLTRFGASAEANQLLVDISRRLCSPENPLCAECPLASSCMHALGPSGDLEQSENSAVACS